MKPIFLFPSIIVLMLVLRHQINKSGPKRGTEPSILELEAEANRTRKQDISKLPYIRIPQEQLPFGSLQPVTNEETTVLSLMEQPILNLTGISNTQLKLDYGPANLDFLSKCDDNFSRLVRALNGWAVQCNQARLYPQAKTILEYSVSIHSDIRQTYQLLADQYFAELDTDALLALRSKAQALPGLTSASIVEYIEKLL